MTFRSHTLWRLSSLPACLLLSGGLLAQVCTNNTTVGRYLVLCQAYLSPSRNASSLLLARALGTVVVDDSGTVRRTSNMNVGGMTITQTVTGKRELNKNCASAISYTQTIGGQPGPTLNITFVVSQQGNSASIAKKEEDKLASRSTINATLMASR